MTTMMSFRTIAAAAQAAKDELRHAHASGMPARPLYVLRPDGDTHEYRIDDRGVIRRTRHAGHVTMGMHIDHSDLPCLIC